MHPEPGPRFKHYELLEMIGKGGMGEVYRATDKRLSRDVAIKTSATQFGERFTREARVIASLNHPNICTLFDVGPDYLVMELVEGTTLAERIKEGPLKLEDATAIMQQVADALEYAHENGVVHRDLKPANIKLRPDGVAKVLDFGLAKMTETTDAGPRSNVSTLIMGDTQTGVVMGTPAYMSPEQAMGKPVDKRADVWAFGVVFYELLTGSRLHRGNSLQEVTASVLKDEPDLTQVPAQARRLLKRCLEKDPNKRLRHVGDVMALLDDPPSGTGFVPSQAASGERQWRWRAAAAVVLVGSALAVWALWKPAAVDLPRVSFEVGAPEGTTLPANGAMIVSPDGRWMAFPAIGADGLSRYWLRSLEGVEARPLEGTESRSALRPPVAWSFDSRWVLAAWDGKLRKMDIRGGPPQEIAALAGGALNGATWNADGVILLGTATTGSQILRVSASGGEVTPVTMIAPEETNHLYPQFLPDQKHFLYARFSANAAKSGIYVGSLEDAPEQQNMERLLASDRQAYYAASAEGGNGHLIFLRDSTLMAQPFDPDRLLLSGMPVVVAQGVSSFAPRKYGRFSVSDNGTLVYRKGGGTLPLLTWLDERGVSTGTLSDPGDYYAPAISPDGSRVAVAVGPEDRRDIWILDIASGSSTRFTFHPGLEDFPVWSPDSNHIVFNSSRDGGLDLYIKPADGSSEEKLLFKSNKPKVASSFSRDGFLIFSNYDENQRNLWVLPDALGKQTTNAQPIALLETPDSEYNGQVSPDGRWLAYVSTESGNPQVWVRPFAAKPAAGAGPKWQVSRGYGSAPVWRPDSKALYFFSGTNQLTTVDIDGGQALHASNPRQLFNVTLSANFNWALSPDGKRFLFLSPPGAVQAIPFTVLVNWAAKLKK